MTDIIEGKAPPHICFQDIDQSPVYGREIFELSSIISTGLDYSIKHPHLSDWLRANFLGDYTTFMKILQDPEHVKRLLSKKEDYTTVMDKLQDTENVKLLLFMRESWFNVPAVYHVVHGAWNICNPDKDIQRMFMQRYDRDGHLRILDKLLSLGAEVDPRDIGGRTPFSIAVSAGCNHTTLKLAERLIKAGADVNSKDRMGYTPLHKCVGFSQLEPIQLLLDNGADPHIKNNHGDSAYDGAPPSIKEILGKIEKKKAKEERNLSRNAVGGSFRQCGVCGIGAGMKVMKRCTGCYLFWYCGKECQLDHWPKHKHDCKVNYPIYTVSTNVSIYLF